MADDVDLSVPAQLTIIRHFSAPPEKVWTYLTDPELRQKWFCAGETGTEPGATIVFDFDHRRISNRPPPEKYKGSNVIRFEGEVTAYDPPRRLACHWPDADPGEATHVDIRLEPSEGGTLLTLVHTRLNANDHRIGAAAGWHAHLDLLADLIRGEPVRDFWDHHEALEKAYTERNGT